MKYNEGDKVRIKSKEWYDANKDEYGNVHLNGEYSWMFTERESRFCGKVVTILLKCTTSYAIVEDSFEGFWTDEMIEGLVEEDIIDIDKFQDDNEMIDIIDECVHRLKDNECQINLPEGYIFKDENGNEILTSKIILEKANTLKTQSDNMETETHRGYYTTEEENTNKSKKFAWFSFFDSNFADKVELDLSNRELIQEDGKWFVVKKKKEYPKTFLECCDVLNIENLIERGVKGYKAELFDTLQKLLICRDAYWKIAGEEMGLGKPWEPDWKSDDAIYVIHALEDMITVAIAHYYHEVLAFPTEEIRDAFYENFKELIEECKELL